MKRFIVDNGISSLFNNAAHPIMPFMYGSTLLIVSFICAVAGLFCLIPASEAALTGKIEITGLHSLDNEEMLDLLGFKEGDSIDAQKVRAGIKRAFRKGIFDDISVNVSDGDPSAISVNVIEKDMIRKVVVQGDYPVSSKKIRELCILKEDTIMRYDLIRRATEELKAGIGMLGYPDAVVSVETAPSSGSHHNILLTISVDAGQPITIKEVKITGTDTVSVGDLKVSAGDVYDQTGISDELRRLKERLKKDGYYRPSAGPYSMNNGVLSLTIRPGKKLSAAIDGNSAISTGRLEKELPFFETEVFSDEAVDEAVNRMLALYHIEGYSSAQIAPVIKSDDQNIQITFFVYEGSQIQLRSVHFRGAALSDQILKSVLTLGEGKPYNPDLRQRDRDTLREYYTALGYLNVLIGEFDVVADPKADAVDIYVVISEGAQIMFGSVDVKGVPDEKRQQLLSIIGLKTGEPYNEIAISDARFRILDHYAEAGFDNIDVFLDRTISGQKAAIVFSISEGSRKIIGKTVVAGNERTKYRVIKREITAYEGTPYSFAAVAKERQRLYKTGLFTDVDVEASDAEGDRKDLIVHLKEGNAGSVEFGFGYADYEKFRGFFEVGYRNLFGMNRQGIFRTELSTLERRFILQYNEPWFLGTALPFRAIFLHEDKKVITIPGRTVRYELQRETLSAGVEKKLTDKIKTDFYYDFSFVNTSNVQPDVVLSREDIGTLAISSVRTSIAYDTRDNPFDPKTGIFAGVTLKLASLLFLSETNFTKVSFYANYYQQLHKRIVLALSAQGGVAEGFGKTRELPIVERFFLGGRSSVRGYEQDMLGPKGSDGNPTGGNAFAMGSVELRTYVGRGVSIVPFFDFGNVWLKMSDAVTSDLKYTTGLGFRYATPVGPLRIDYGIKLKRVPGESNGEIHFSIGHAF